ncbi:hypothetical protein M758_10G095700 [Ceratodon purpureus]|nr:hypothetical protein M758_10G095700 [Ceratodon purpureus]
MPYLSRQLLFKIACTSIAFLVTFAGVMMSMDLLQQIPEADTDPKYWSGTNLPFSYQMEQYEACSECTSYHHSSKPAPPFLRPLLTICKPVNWVSHTQTHVKNKWCN